MGTRHGLLLLPLLAFLLASPSPAQAQFYGPVAAWEYPYCPDGSFYDPWFGCTDPFWGGGIGPFGMGRGGFRDGAGCWCGTLTCYCGSESGVGSRFNCSLSQRRPYFVLERRSLGPPDMERRLAWQQQLPRRTAIIGGKNRGSASDASGRFPSGGERGSAGRGGGHEGSRGQGGSRSSSGGNRGGGHQGGGHQGGGGGAAPHRPR